MDIAKENVNFNFLQRVANANTLTQALLHQIVMSELTNIADQIVEADNYHELTKHVAEQIISQFDTLLNANKDMGVQLWNLLNIAKKHGLFARNEIDSSVKGPALAAQPVEFSMLHKNTKPNNQAYELLAQYQRKLKPVRFAFGTEDNEGKRESQTERRQRKEDEKAIRYFTEQRKNR